MATQPDRVILSPSRCVSLRGVLDRVFASPRVQRDRVCIDSGFLEMIHVVSAAVEVGFAGKTVDIPFELIEDRGDSDVVLHAALGKWLEPVV